MKKDLLLLTILLGFFIFVIFYWGRPFESFGCKNNRFKIDVTFSGKITKKIKDSKSHSHEIIILENGQQFEWEDDRYYPFQIFDLFEIGDSIVKNKGSLELLVKRDTSTFVVNLYLPCDEDKK